MPPVWLAIDIRLDINGNIYWSACYKPVTDECLGRVVPRPRTTCAGRRANVTDASETRTYVSQEDIPRVPLEDALRIPRALRDFFASEPTKPLRVAEAIEISPKGGRFRELCGAAIGYGLTEGGAFAEEIKLTPLARRILSPTVEGDDLAAMREAVLQPTVMRRFLEKYSEAQLPPKRIAENVLVEEMDVPERKAGEAYNLIVENAEQLGLLREVKGKRYVDLDLDTEPVTETPEVREEDETPGSELLDAKAATTNGAGAVERESLAGGEGTPRDLRRNRKVFITHGRNRAIVDQLKELLAFGDFEPVVALETEAASIPVPEKLMEHMRACSAAIIHVGTERKLLDQQGEKHRVLNPNVLIEIGAALALYDRRFILLVEDGVQLPSNLQGLYEVRYEGGKLDYDATMKLLKAFNEFKK